MSSAVLRVWASWGGRSPAVSAWIIDGCGAVTRRALDPELGDSAAPGIGFAIGSDSVKRVADRLLAAAP